MENSTRRFAWIRWLLSVGFCLLLAIGVSAMGFATDAGSVCGVVRDLDGRAVAGANVTLSSHSAGSSQMHTSSGPAGEYRFSGLTEGEYTLGVEMEGYAAPTPRVVQITPEANSVTVDLVLVRSSRKPGF